ncbi:PepSY domain-containing protein [Pseudoalteromonas agarivorans]|uniref:PepSY domain-containing protein n=1 Tax=Pseudoalteromonas agarivorans TaxID=176102 RepID=UPI002117E3D2|nr:PepSY domain-containing protein [Pseudoalteromonas agarivorans]MCQ8822465.1 PepSY domain-containing protein [Pseudoalteromonas agarivorans]
MRFNGSWRKIARRVHLYLGLSIGGVLALIALTGSILVYYPELDENISSLSTETARPINWDTAYQTLKTHYPDKQGSWRLESTKDKHYIPARYYNQNETVVHAFAPLMVWLSPDGGLYYVRMYGVTTLLPGFITYTSRYLQVALVQSL